MEIKVVALNRDFDNQQLSRIIELHFDEVHYMCTAENFLLKQLHSLALHFPEEQFKIIISEDADLEINDPKMIPQNIALYSSKNELILQGKGIVRFNYFLADKISELDKLCATLQERMDRYSNNCPKYIKPNLMLSLYAQKNYPLLHQFPEYEHFIDVMDFIIRQHNMDGYKTHVWDLVQECLRLFSHINEKDKKNNRFFVDSKDVFSIDAFRAMTHVLCGLRDILNGDYDQKVSNYQKLLARINEFKATDRSQLIIANTLKIAGVSLISASCMALPFLLTLSVIAPALIAVGTCILILGGLTAASIGFSGEDTALIQRSTKENISTLADQLCRQDIQDDELLDQVKVAHQIQPTPVNTPIGISLSH